MEKFKKELLGGKYNTPISLLYKKNQKKNRK